MTVTILLPLAIYDDFLQKCDQAPAELEILKNGVIHRIPKEDHFERIVEIRCERVDAAKLLSLASVYCQEAQSYITKALADSQSPD